MSASLHTKYRVGVLRGGPSHEYDLSLQTGAHVMRHIPDNYEVHDIFIGKDGKWHVRGVEVEPHRALRHIDIVFNALHGHYGEDGKVQRFLDSHAHAYTGSEGVPALLSFNKYSAKKFFESQGIKSPLYVYIDPARHHPGEVALELFKKMPLPLIVKPVMGGSSHGIWVVHTFVELVDALETYKSYNTPALVEEYISGLSVSSAVIEGFRDKKLYTLMPLQISLPKGYDYFDFERRHEVEYVPLGRLGDEFRDEIASVMEKAHTALGLRHYSQGDFILSPSRGVYLLEVNALPSLTHDSPFVRSLEFSGVSIHAFLDHILNLGRGHRYY